MTSPSTLIRKAAKAKSAATAARLRAEAAKLRREHRAVGKKAKPDVQIDANAILKRALLFDASSVAVVLIGPDGKSINMWHTNDLLRLSGAAQNLAYEVSWSIPGDCRTKTFPKPPRKKFAFKSKLWPMKKKAAKRSRK